jgi:hypothetical protein
VFDPYLLRQVPHGKNSATSAKACIRTDFHKNSLQFKKSEREANLSHRSGLTTTLYKALHAEEIAKVAFLQE